MTHRLYFPLPQAYHGGIFSDFNLVLVARLVACVFVAYTFYHRVVIFHLVMQKLSVFQAFRPLGVEGSTGYLFSSSRIIQRTLDVFKSSRNSLIQMKLGILHYIVICRDKEFIGRVFEDQGNYARKCSERYKIFTPLVGEGFLQGPLYRNGRWWRSMSLLNRFLRTTLVNAHIRTIDGRASNLLTVFDYENTAHGMQFDCFPSVSRCVLDIMFEVATGAQCTTDYFQAARDLNRMLGLRMFSWWQLIWLYHVWWARKQEQEQEQECLRVMHGEVLEHIRRRIPLAQPYHLEEDDGSTRRSFLEALASTRGPEHAAETPFTEDDYRDAIQYFIFHGHYPIATSICFALFVLGWNVELQEELYEEQKAIFDWESNKENLGKAPTPAALVQMDHLGRFIDEVLRVYPPVPLIYLETRRNEHLFDETLPAGSHLWIHMFSYLRTFHGDEHDTFQRGFVEDPPQPRPSVFGSKRYGCAGPILAITVMKIILSRIIRKYMVHSLTTEDKIGLKCETVLRMQNSHKIQLVTRVY